METESFRITEYLPVMRVHDREGRVSRMEDRYCGAFIATLRGRIHLTQDGRRTVLDPEHPVFIPEGCSYLNECREEADSLIFCFRTERRYERIENLPPLPEATFRLYFDRLSRLTGDRPGETQAALGELYALASALFFAMGQKKGRRLAETAAENLRRGLGDPATRCGDVASELGVSEVYLRKLFLREYGMPPSRFLTAARMEEARRYLMEKMPVGETAMLTGYSDVAQFSRAYRRYFGCPPSET